MSTSPYETDTAARTKVIADLIGLDNHHRITDWNLSGAAGSPMALTVTVVHFVDKDTAATIIAT